MYKSEKGIKCRIIDKIQKSGIFTENLRRRHTFDGVIPCRQNNHKTDKILKPVEENIPKYMECFKFIYESYKEISLKSGVIETLCKEILRTLDCNNSKV